MIDSKVYKVAMSSPDDMRGLDQLVTNSIIDPRDVVAVLGKTEGNGCVNDFTRGFATMAFSHYLHTKTGTSIEDIKHKVAFVMSGGTEGVMSPHAVIFTSKDVEGGKSQTKSFVVKSGFTRNFLPEEQGTLVMVKEVANVVEKLMKEAGIESVEDVHFVQIKCPLLTSERINDAYSRNQNVVTEDTYKSMGFNRGASALGVAVALNEVKLEDIKEEDICHNWSLFSTVASTSAGIELENCEVIIMGNSKLGNGEYFIGHDVMQNSIDIQAVLRAMKNAGLKFEGLPTENETSRIVNVFAKAESSSHGFVLNRRTTLLTDSDINHTRQARSVVNAVIASVVQDPMVYVSGGAEHQGPDGGGPVAVIVKLK
ncbi:MAG: ring-opening amidohydrolase [Erysipelothrix sp.]|nr:ring-opening amidohydrolase [Erysipelothrix sp.]